MKIKDLVVGTTDNINLVVKAATIRTTKTNKPFLSLELTDGTDSITANNWDWYKDTTPNKNDVLSIKARVGEWNGNKQLTIQEFVVDNSIGLSQFVPDGGVDIDEYNNKTKELIATITNTKIHDLVLNVFRDHWKLWSTVPGAKSVHHAYLAGTLKHSVDTAVKAVRIAESLPWCNLDLVIAGALLHDFGKLWTYGLDGVVIDYTEDGQAMDHIFIGASKLDNYLITDPCEDSNVDIIWALKHIILSHHGTLEHGSPVTPKFLEAWLVHYADAIDAKLAAVLELNAKAPEGAIQTEKNWILGKLFTQEWVHNKLK